MDVALASDSPPEFAARLRLALGEGEPADWAALAKRAARFRVGTCPGASFLLGPLPTVPVERKARAVRKTRFGFGLFIYFYFCKRPVLLLMLWRS